LEVRSKGLRDQRSSQDEAADSGPNLKQKANEQWGRYLSAPFHRSEFDGRLAFFGKFSVLFGTVVSASRGHLDAAA
jgi:hypothetical protein